MSNESQEHKGVIGETTEDGFPVIWRFINELPYLPEKSKLPWLAIVSWEYDGSSRNGMPPEEINSQMISLEHALDESVVGEMKCRHAYSRTGNHLKEFVYYIRSRDAFMADLNNALESHPEYPIEINFYEDKEWKDFQQLLELFGKS